HDALPIYCVTWGMFTQLPSRRGPEMRWMRDSGSTAVGPNCAKSTAGTAGSAGHTVSVPPPPPPSAPLTNALTSSWVMRSLKPCPVTRPRSTPSSRANWRTEGPAWARENPGSSMGARSLRYEVGTPSNDLGVSLPPGVAAGGGAAAVGGVTGGAGGAGWAEASGRGAGGAAAAAAAGAAACDPSAFTVASRSPVLTLPPLLA